MEWEAAEGQRPEAVTGTESRLGDATQSSSRKPFLSGPLSPHLRSLQTSLVTHMPVAVGCSPDMAGYSGGEPA